MNLTRNFSLLELTKSDTAIRKGIDNNPNADQIEKLNLKYDDHVVVEKGGEIIPKIVDVVISKRSRNSKEFVFIHTHNFATFYPFNSKLSKLIIKIFRLLKLLSVRYEAQKVRNS